MSKKILVSLTIPDYPDKVITAAARRPVLYVSPTATVRGRKDIPDRYKDPTKYHFDSRGVLTNTATGKPHIANPRTAGRPRYWVVNFQDIWNGNLSKQDRAMKVDKLKDVLRPHIKTIIPLPQDVYPVEISITLYDTVCPVDVSNRGAIYTKVIEDLLVKEGIIPDDSVEYVNCSGRTKFIKVEDEKDKKMNILITKSDTK